MVYRTAIFNDLEQTQTHISRPFFDAEYLRYGYANWNARDKKQQIL